METPDADGPPPTPFDEAKRRDRRAIIWSVVAAVVLLVPTSFGVAALIGATDDIGQGSPSAAPGGDDGEDGGVAPDTGRDEVEVPTLDLDVLSGTDAEFGRVLTDVDRSEQAMLRAQEGMNGALFEASPDDDPDEVLGAVSDAAGDGQRDLQELRSDLTQPVEDDDARQLRDTYLSHLDAWVRYLVAIEEDPEVLLNPEAGSALTLSIDTTGYAFADILRGGLPADLDPDVVEVAEAIADRGFPERDGTDAV